MPDEADSVNEWLTGDEASKRLGVSQTTVYRLAREGKVQRKKVGRRSLFRCDPTASAAPDVRRARITLLVFLDRSIEKIQRHPWFVAVAGLSSIAGLVLATIPLWHGTRRELPQPSRSAEIATPAYRLRYLLVNRPWALTEGTLRQAYPDVFSKEPFILQTEPFNVLRRLEAIAKDSPSHVDSSRCELNRVKEKLETDPSYRMSFTRKRQHAGATTDLSCGFEVAAVWGYLGSANIASVIGRYSQVPDFVRRVMEENPSVPDLVMEAVDLQECDCDWKSQLRFRSLEVLVLDIENITTAPVSLDSVEGNYQSRCDLCLAAWTDDAVQDVSTKYQFPARLLAAGEHVLAPAKVLLGPFEAPNRYAADDSTPVEPEEQPVVLTPEVGIRVTRKEANRNAGDAYVLGSVFEPVTVGGLGPVRPFNKSQLVLQEGLEEGSCPYVSLFDSQEGVWRRVGTVISDRRGKENEGESKLAMTGVFAGRLKIQEMEEESSFLDQVFLKALLPDRREVKLYPQNRLLRYSDHRYLVLRKGEAIVLKFPRPPIAAKKLVLVSRGYYVPNVRR